MSHGDSEPICFLNGAIRPATDAHVPINDLGFIHGVTVSEQLRTFRGRPFLLAEHLQRFKRGLKLLQIDLPELEGLNSAVEAVAAHNYRLHGNNQELGICLFGTPGPSPRFKYSNKLNQEFRPTVCVHTLRTTFCGDARTLSKRCATETGQHNRNTSFLLAKRSENPESIALLPG